MAGSAYNPNGYGGNQTSPIALPTTGGAAINALAGSLFTIVPAGSATFTATVVPAGVDMTLVVTTSGTTSYTLTFGTGFKTVGTLATGTVTAKVFTIQFVSDGVNMNEVGRTAAM